MKDVMIPDFVDELIKRIDKAQSIDCCKEEIKKFATLAKTKMAHEKISVDWH